MIAASRTGRLLLGLAIAVLEAAGTDEGAAMDERRFLQDVFQKA